MSEKPLTREQAIEPVEFEPDIRALGVQRLALLTVYVESNFVLEQAIEHEQSESCQRLISLAAAGSIHLVW